MKETNVKKWFLIIGSIIIIVLLGSGMITLHGHGQRSYNACVRLGQNDVIDGNYHDALNYFQGAIKVDPTGSHAKNDLDQIQSYVSGNHYLSQHKLSQAAKNYHRAVKINAIAALNRRSKLAYQNIESLRNNTNKFTTLYDQALELNHRGDFKRSTQHLDRIISDPGVDDKYFKGFRSKVEKLIKSNNRKQRSSLISSNVTANHNKNNQFKLKSPKVIADHPSKVTITKARRDIQRAGVDAHQMNNQDVANLIRQANKHHISIYRYAKDNY